MYSFLLLNSRECFTLLFPEVNTQIVLILNIAFNVVQVIFFLALDWSSGLFYDLSIGGKILNSLFQSISTRQAGFQVVDLNIASQAMIFLLTIFTYIATIPASVTVRSSAVVHETKETAEAELSKTLSARAAHSSSYWFQIWDWLKSRNFLLRHALVLFFFLLSICIIEDSQLRESRFSLFSVIFETTSAYGTVGLSIGYLSPTVLLSTSAYFSGLSKFVMLLVCLQGRHRGLPTSLDDAYSLRVHHGTADDGLGEGELMLEGQIESIPMSRLDADGQWRRYYLDNRRRSARPFELRSLSSLL
jgi:Trk-type K+ transport system membrane component